MKKFILGFILVCITIFVVWRCGMKNTNELSALISNGENEKAIALIDEGTDLNKTQPTLELLVSIFTQGQSFEKTPLCTACETGNIEMIKYLLQNGADPNVVNINGEYPLVSFLSKYYAKDDEVLELMISSGADLNKGTYIAPLSALMTNYYMAEDEYRRKIEKDAIIMLDNGADWTNNIDGTKEEHSNMLHFVACTNETEFLQCLLEYDEAEKTINDKDMYGNTPITLAAINNAWESYDMLLAAGADENIKNNKDTSAKDYEEQNRK